ncbi:hypothetical protein MSMTP_1191 [Methanosarcina sp. MTP4]|uniref:hypothetical protein n=1 Tax=Methanosarcina sp. MTP4 TaxID=1434100 RepID=UPI000615B88A|nr:hypothetical protein [Methanosarcina sp. MTP4]AKB24660.1 hypothetical protein MSMTP_1191 [Methanosarcina sp. MTP4]
MVNISELGNYANIIIAFGNLILVAFVFLQIRDSRKPIISINVLSRDKEQTDRQFVLESGDLYAIISNYSKNTARSLDIDCQFKFKDQFTTENDQNKKLDYLNPGEATRFFIQTSDFMEKHTEYFEEIEEGNTTIITPKETLRIDVSIKVRYNPIFANHGKYETTDDYYIEWGHAIKTQDANYVTRFHCWNKRNKNFYIYKINKTVQEVKIIENPNEGGSNGGMF